MQIHTKALTLRIPKELFAQLTKLPKQARQHRSTFVHDILEKAVKKSTLVLGAVLLFCAAPAHAQQPPTKSQIKHDTPFHVTSVRVEVPKDWCTTGKCTAQRFIIQGYDESTQYVANCVETRTTDDFHLTVSCPRVRAGHDYGSYITSDAIGFDGPTPGDSRTIVSGYGITEQEERRARK